MKYFQFVPGSCLLTALLLLTAASAATAIDVNGDSLLKMRSESLGGGTPLFQDIGGTIGGDSGGFQGDVARPMLLSLLMPGLGEVTMGYKRGYAMMALDVASWIAARSANDRGEELREDYYDYADIHWSEDKLDAAFGSNNDFTGTFYYEGVTTMENLSLWVSRVDDEREYYENLGKWDQFVFGWDDFADPRNWVGTGADSGDLKDARVSGHREIYRSMRIESNDEFARRDLLIKINMGTRLLSMLQVAWLKGVFKSDDNPGMMSIAGHELAIINQTRGLTSGRIGLSLSY